MGKFIISKKNKRRLSVQPQSWKRAGYFNQPGYSTKPSCESGIGSVKLNAQEDAKFERNTANDGRCYFNLKAGNGQIIGTSQMYESDNGMENGIESVKKMLLMLIYRGRNRLLKSYKIFFIKCLIFYGIFYFLYSIFH